jgi:hypothetical protein
MTTLDNFRSYFPPASPTLSIKANDLNNHTFNKSWRILDLAALTAGTQQFCWIGIRVRDNNTQSDDNIINRDKIYNNANRSASLSSAKTICFLQQEGGFHITLGPVGLLLPDDLWLPFTYPLSSTFVKMLHLKIEIHLQEGKENNYIIDLFGQEFADVRSYEYPTVFLDKDNMIDRIFRPRAFVSEILTPVHWYRNGVISFHNGVKFFPTQWRYLDEDYPGWNDKTVAVQCEINAYDPIYIFGDPVNKWGQVSPISEDEE